MRRMVLTSAAAILAAMGLGVANAHEGSEKGATAPEVERQAGREGHAAGKPMGKGEIDTKAELLQRLHHVNLREIAMGQLALEKTDDPQVREYARMLIDDHTRGDEKVRAHADELGVELTRPQLQFPQLQRLSGDEFDRTFLRQNVRVHGQLIERLQAFQPQLEDPELQEELQAAIDHLRQHREQAMATLQRLDTGRRPVRGEESPDDVDVSPDDVDEDASPGERPSDIQREPPPVPRPPEPLPGDGNPPDDAVPPMPR